MNQNKADTYIPALARTSQGTPLWGRLTSLSPTEAEFLSHFEVPAGRVIALSFDLGRSNFEDVRARINTALRDREGYYNYALVFIDETQRGLIKNAIQRKISILDRAARSGIPAGIGVSADAGSSGGIDETDRGTCC